MTRKSSQNVPMIASAAACAAVLSLCRTKTANGFMIYPFFSGGLLVSTACSQRMLRHTLPAARAAGEDDRRHRPHLAARGMRCAGRSTTARDRTSLQRERDLVLQILEMGARDLIERSRVERRSQRSRQTHQLRAREGLRV